MVFENVGGFTFDAAFACLGPGGRIAVCGGIASYCNAKPILNSINPMQVRPLHCEPLCAAFCR